MKQLTITTRMEKALQRKPEKFTKIAEFLKKLVDCHGMIDVGKGAERYLCISREELLLCLYILDKWGYRTFRGRIPQATNKDKWTYVQVLCPLNTPPSAIYDFGKVRSLSSLVEE